MYMDVKIKLNGKLIIDSVDQDIVLLDFCRKHNCFSVKRGCESGNCGLCTVLLDGKPVLSCSMPIGRADPGRKSIIRMECTCSDYYMGKSCSGRSRRTS